MKTATTAPDIGDRSHLIYLLLQQKGGGWLQQGKWGWGGEVGRGMVSCRLGFVVVMAMAMAMASSRPQTAESVVAFVVHPRRQQQLLLVAGSCCNGNCNCNSSSSYTFAPTCCRCRCQSSTWCLCRLCEISAAHVENVCCLVASATFCCSCCLCCCCCRWRLLFWSRVAGNVLCMALAAIGQAVAAWISNLMLHVRYPLAACNGQRATRHTPQ